MIIIKDNFNDDSDRSCEKCNLIYRKCLKTFLLAYTFIHTLLYIERVHSCFGENL